MSQDEILREADGRQVVRIGETVRRPTGWWTPAVHALLRPLEQTGFGHIPRVLGVDGDGREILTYVPGLSGADGWAMIVEDEGLTRFARLLRAYHDAVRTFRPADGAAWSHTAEPLQSGEIICHG